MSCNIKVSRDFAREAKRLTKKYPSFKNDFNDFLDSLKENPLQGVEITKNIRKIRMVIKSERQRKIRRRKGYNIQHTDRRKQRADCVTAHIRQRRCINRQSRCDKANCARHGIPRIIGTLIITKEKLYLITNLR